ncbi:MAG: O-antigen ligase family protein [Chloroflexota bacterium]
MTTGRAIERRDPTAPDRAAVDASLPTEPHVGGRRRPADGLERVLWWGVRAGLLATLLLAPFEGLLLTVVRFPDARFRITDVELAGALTFLAWVALLVVERRRPAIPRRILVALAALGGVVAASALAAGDNRDLASQVTSRVVLGWMLLLVTVDTVRRPRMALVVLAAVAAIGSISALVGWIAASRDSMDGLFGAGRLFTVGGVARMSGTWDYPTVAAMAWTAVLLLLLPLVAWRGRGRLAPVAPVAAIIATLLGASVLMTLTRGAFLGLAAGLAVLLLVAAFLGARRLAIVAASTSLLLAAGGTLLYLQLPLPLERLGDESDADLYGADYAVAALVTAAPGTALQIPITVTNRGDATWDPGASQPWRLAVVPVDPVSGRPAGEHQVAAQLPGRVAPGESVQLSAHVTTQDRPGRFDLAWDMQQGSAMDFSERGVRVAVTRIDVRPGVSTTIDPTAVPRSALLYPDQIPVLDRADLWTAAIRLFEQHPLLGVGPGVYRRLYGPELGLTRWDAQIHSNDLYLELAATTGILGLGAFLVLVGACVAGPVRGLRRLRALRLTRARSRRRERQLGARALLVAGSLAATAAWFAHQVVDHFLWMSIMGILFWVTIGIGVGLSGRLGRAPGARGSVR